MPGSNSVRSQIAALLLMGGLSLAPGGCIVAGFDSSLASPGKYVFAFPAENFAVWGALCVLTGLMSCFSLSDQGNWELDPLQGS